MSAREQSLKERCARFGARQQGASSTYDWLEIGEQAMGSEQLKKKIRW